jgi:hypothetical protein
VDLHHLPVLHQDLVVLHHLVVFHQDQGHPLPLTGGGLLKTSKTGLINPFQAVQANNHQQVVVVEVDLETLLHQEDQSAVFSVTAV